MTTVREKSAKTPVQPAVLSGPPRSTQEDRAALPFRALRSDDFVRSVAAALLPTAVEASGCTACELAKTRSSVVFGAGSARSGIVLIGEAPGANEDAEGLPFVGRSGQLLGRMLTAAGLQRQDVYICNVVKCRPPGNRDPRPDEIAACAHFLRAQLAALRPRVVCALGLHAVRSLLPTKLPMAKIRGRVLDYNGIPAIATYHPAALLRSPGLQPKAHEDLGLLRTLAEEAAARDVQAGAG